MEKIAVLGAGPMGLAVAYQLVKDGYNPVLFEADTCVGGMSAAFNFGGLNIERYYHFHCTSDYDFFAMLKELGIEDCLHWVETKMGFYHAGKVSPWGNPVALLKFPNLSLAGKFRYGLHAFLCTRRKNWKPLDKLEATSWIKRWIGNDAYDVLWSKLFDYKFYDYAHRLSAAWIWSRIRRIGQSRYNVFREKLGYLDGGSDTLLQAMQAYLEKNGCDVRLGKSVSEVVIKEGKIQGVRQGVQIHAFDKVVSTIPLPYVPMLMPGLPKDILDKYAQLKNIAVVCVITKLKKPLTENFWLNVNDPGMDIPGLVEYTNLRPLADHVVYVPFYMPGEHEKFTDSDEVFINKVKRYMMTINPELSEDDFIDVRASRYRYSQPICEPGHIDKLPPCDLPVQGLWAADTSYYYPEDRGISESIGFGRKLARKVVSE